MAECMSGDSKGGADHRHLASRSWSGVSSRVPECHRVGGVHPRSMHHRRSGSVNITSYISMSYKL